MDTTNLPDAADDQTLKDIVAGYSERRQDERLKAKQPGDAFDPRVAYDLALGTTPAKVCADYGIDQPTLMALLQNQTFLKRMVEYQKEFAENGTTFRAKARIQAEDLLRHSYNIATDAAAPAAVRADLIKWTSKVAGLEPAPAKDSAGGPGGGFSLNIIMGNPAAPGSVQLVRNEPLTLDNE
jgi:hypothetical protein